MKEIIGKLDFVEIKNFCSLKDNAKRMRKQVTHRKEIFVKDTCDKELFPKMYIELLNLNSKTNNPV